MIRNEGEKTPDEPQSEPSLTNGSPREFVEGKGGFDWYDGCAYGRWNSQQWERLTGELKRLRDAAEDGREAIYVAPDGDQLAVRPHGMKGINAKWVLDWDGCTFGIVNRQDEREGAFNVWIHIGSVKLMQDGFIKARSDVLGLLASMGFECSRVCPSRTDFCIDLAGVDCREFVEQFLGDHAICLARKWGVYGEGVPGVKSSTGFKLGTKTQIRIYDKLAEVKDQPAKAAILIDQRYGGEVPAVATRVEFQLNRDSLKDNWGIESDEDLMEQLPSIIEWLTHEWFRLVDDFDRENRNHKHATTSSLWAMVQGVFARVFDGVKHKKPSLRKYVPNSDALTKQLVGVASSILAASNEAIESAEEFADRVAAIVRENAVRGFAGVKAKLEEFALRAMLPIGNCGGVFDEWNAEGESTVGTNVKQEEANAYQRACCERQAAKDRANGVFLFDVRTPQVEASF